ncbi:TauD/TfdA family dioxygenase [Chitinophaga sp. GbtcB8]|uniref:TauD/TfdA family dioxygenase n=1 Tax=Chitinophaga sp. GbtcB8 TaxID=2824753 RepID=UPI001C30934F|nr:TauD/TfdA family dioxygenase [Chitinophaga sp. GbtcB8]
MTSNYREIAPTQLDAGIALPDDITLTRIGNQYTKATLITPAQTYPELKSWISGHVDFVRSLYQQDRVLLFKGFSPFKERKDLSEIVGLVSDSKALQYAEPSTPRTKVLDDIYTSTEYPKEQQIAQHNEHSYSDFWPKKLFFYCEQPAASGGQTPICDSAEVYKLIPEEISRRFESKGGVMYVRNFTEEMDIRWQDFFNTNDKRAAEEYCEARKMGYKWQDDEKLMIYQVSQAVLTEKTFGRKVWFNQAHLFHYSNLNEEISAYLIDVYGMENLPRNTFYADGSEIAVADLDRIRKAYQDAMFRFEWNKGDLLIMDNVNFTHGRDTYSGDRSLLVSMSEEDGISNYNA